MTHLVNGWADLFAFWSWQALLIFSLAWIIVRWDRWLLPAVRHRIWLFGMIAVVLLPALTALLTLIPVLPPAIEPLSYVANLPAAVKIVSDQAAAFQPGPVDVRPPTTVQFATVARAILFIAWLTGFTWSLTTLCGSWWKMRDIRKRARRVRSSRLSPVPVGLSAEVTSPVLAGVFHPMILLPSKIAEWTTDEERRAIVLHEEAHLQRGDHYLIVVQRLLDVVFFFHPMVRYASRQLSLERELACDEQVLRAGADSAAYAEVILKVAERDLQQRRRLEPAFNASRKILERRIDMIFKGQHRLSPPTLGRFAFLTTAFLLVAVTSWLLIPQRSLGATAATDMKMIQEAVTKYLPKVVSEPVLVAQTPVRPSAGTSLARVPVVLAAQAAPQAAQPGSVSGRISDSSGALIPGVFVKVKGSQAEFFATTDSTGTFNFAQLPADRYRLEASLPGFTTRVFTFDLAPGATRREDVRLYLAALEMTLEISAQRPVASPITVTAAGVLPAASTPPPPLRIGGDVAQATLVSAQKPVYPPAARAVGIQGEVLIQAVIGTDGSVMNPTVINRGVNPELAQSALQAVSQWRYKPALLNVQPVEIITVISVNFTLSD